MKNIIQMLQVNNLSDLFIIQTLLNNEQPSVHSIPDIDQHDIYLCRK